MMALAFAINIEVIRDDPQGEQWEETLEPGGMSGLLIRLPGTSRSGPCPNCQQYFHMHHDGTGKTVPIRPLHTHCVCRDIPVELNELMGGPPELKRHEWMSKPDNEDAVREALGPGRWNLLQAQLATGKKDPWLVFFAHQEAPNKNAKPLKDVVKTLERLPKRELLRMARGIRGITIPKGADRNQIIRMVINARIGSSRNIGLD